ncbi:Metallo-dependent phosphatase-like protein [Peziza echinospora]|nr:Metallo-dependent phosphatase-like protein [Peziza echinospora]
MAGTGGGGSSTDKALPVQHHTPFTQLITLPFTFPPPPPPPPPPPHKPPHPPKKLVPKRLILIGDVHGAFDELVRLLEKVEFKPEEDHVILTGDLVSKGPKSGAVLDLLSHYSGLGAASCVRGNHDDRVLAAYARLHRKKKEKGKEEEEEDNHRRKRLSDLAVARTLTPQQASFLATCPLILRVHGAGEKGGDLLAVHAGIVPGVALMKQRPALLMNMRTIIPDDGKKKKKGKKGKKDGGVWGGGRPSSSTKGRHWAEVWNEFEERGGAVERNIGDRPTTVVYGHYAAQGLDIRRWTKGLDSGCVRGGRLTALVVEGGWEADGHEEEKVYGNQMSLVSVKCRAYVD